MKHASTCSYHQDGILAHCDCGASTASLNPVLRVRLADQYGRPVVHPVNQQARWLAEIAGTKTLTPHAIKLARMMGFAVEYTQPALPKELA